MRRRSGYWGEQIGHLHDSSGHHFEERRRTRACNRGSVLSSYMLSLRVVRGLRLAPKRMRRASSADPCAVVTGGARSDGARRGAETPAEAARKMRVVAKAAGVGNIAEWLTCLHQRAAFDQTRRMIQTGRTYVVTACRSTDCEQLLQIAQ